jgi:predicted dehydrogenase
MINVALIGLGYWGMNYLRVLQNINGIKLSYVCDSNPEVLKDVPSYVKTTLDYEEIAKDDDIKVTFLVTPASTHYKIAKLFLEQGKHLLVEKPLTMSTKEAFELARIAKENKAILMVGHIYCFHPAIQYLRKLIKNKKLGKVFYGIAIRIGLGPIRQDASCTWDLATHDIAILDYLFNIMPIYVTATATTFLQKDKNIYDYAYIHLEYPEMQFAITTSWYAAEKIRSWYIATSKYLIKFDDMNKEWPLAIYQSNIEKIKQEELIKKQSEIYKGKLYMPRIEKEEPLMKQVEHFINCVRFNKEPLTNAYQAIRVISILEAVEESIEKGKKVKVKSYDIE